MGHFNVTKDNSCSNKKYAAKENAFGGTGRNSIAQVALFQKHISNDSDGNGNGNSGSISTGSSSSRGGVQQFQKEG